MSRLPKQLRLISLRPAPNQEVLACVKLLGLAEHQVNQFLALFPRGDVMVLTAPTGVYLNFYLKRFAERFGEVSDQSQFQSLLTELKWISANCSEPSPFIWRFCGRQLDLRHRTAIMAVLNCTPDSFSDGGKYFHPQAALEHARQMVAAGADLIDIGGESTRPGSRPISAQQEMDRVLPVIEQLRREDEVPISIDTYKAEVARAAVQTGAEIINDISGATFDPQILAVAKEFKTGLVLMHIQGKMETMQIAPAYKDVVEEILIDLAGKVDRALAAGIKDGWLVIDPGIGFGKRWFDNYDILNRLTELRILGLPILIGASRKSFLGKFLSADPQQRLEGSLLANGVAIGNNANIVRVHDVVETQKAVRIADLFYRRAWGVAADILEEQFQ